MTPAEALESASTQLERNPSDPLAWGRAAQALEAVGAPADAAQAWRSALQHRPHWALGWMHLGRVLAQLGVRHEPEACYRKALRLDATCHAARRALGLRLLHTGALDEAKQCLLAVLHTTPSDVDARAGLALCLHRQHDSHAAWELLREVSATPVAALAAAEVAPLVGEVDAADVLVLQASQQWPEDAQLLHAKAEVLARRAAFADAYETVVAANDRRKLAFDAERHQQVVSALIDAFPATVATTVGSRSSCEPVFIVGMPRSGSTLVESILVQHAAISTSGERHTLAELSTALGGYPLSISPEQHMAAAQHYRLELDESARWMLDKMPNNVLHLGLAAQLFPHARVIYVRRDADETAWSCFRHAMAAGLRWATSLDGIASWTVGIERLMAHWRGTGVLPIHELCYEELVSRPEAVTRDLLRFLDLPFDPACVSPEETNRPVNTMSSNAVRQPIHTDAVRRAEPFRPWLGDLAGRRDHYRTLAAGK